MSSGVGDRPAARIAGSWAGIFTKTTNVMMETMNRTRIRKRVRRIR
jgi:hypothetical protein